MASDTADSAAMIIADNEVIGITRHSDIISSKCIAIRGIIRY